METMRSNSPVEVADRLSRARAILFALAAVVFVAIYVVLRPLLFSSHQASLVLGGVIDPWAINALLLLTCLATGGGLLNRREVRTLVNDPVARDHYRTAVVVGYWTAMLTALALYLVPTGERYTARDAVFVIVTPSLSIALLVFAWLELRAHRDAESL